MAQLVSLSDEDLAQLRDELAGGRAPMVWFTPAAVGVPAGGSAKVVAFDEPGEGDFIQVRPTGSKDVLSFSPSELTRTRPPRKKAVARPTRAAAPARPAART
ncbi:MAG TPA: cell wall anchor protein, partial [Actinophytocola sp.]|nr:cell wall anchor protein [Actinophytocola sp.]